MIQKVVDRLLVIAHDEASGDPITSEMLATPNWDGRLGCPTWERYVPGDMTELWPDLSFESRLILLIRACRDMDLALDRLDADY